ncbi:MAG: hypothetical protein QW103_02970, partial [Candidatus Pacearchaeota archaeon]
MATPSNFQIPPQIPGKKYKIVGLKKASNEDVKALLDWFLNIHPFTEKLYNSAPESVKKFFQEVETQNQNN